MTSLKDKNRLIQQHLGVGIDGIWGGQTADAVIAALAITAPVEAARKQSGLRDEAAFFTAIRRDPFGGSISSDQLRGIKSKLTAFGEAGWPVSFAAYAFATSYWETNKTMLPVEEGYYISSNWDRAEAWRKRNLRYFPWYGRGDVQLTWERNYKKADIELDLGGRLVADPRLALDPEISARIMVRGMEEGWFTGKDMDDYLPDGPATFDQYKLARYIINGRDKRAAIAQIAIDFQDALVKGGWA